MTVLANNLSSSRQFCLSLYVNLSTLDLDNNQLLKCMAAANASKEYKKISICHLGKKKDIETSFVPDSERRKCQKRVLYREIQE